VVTTGIALTVTALFTLAAAHAQSWHLVVGKLLIALANGLCVTARVTGTATAVDRADTGIASSLVLVTRVIGFAVGVQISGAFLTAGTPAGPVVQAESSFVTGFVVAGAVSALSLFVVRTLARGVKERATAVGSPMPVRMPVPHRSARSSYREPASRGPPSRTG
jgi:hypothetical protein